jgi:hypothetical protein
VKGIHTKYIHILRSNPIHNFNDPPSGVVPVNNPWVGFNYVLCLLFYILEPTGQSAGCRTSSLRVKLSMTMTRPRVFCTEDARVGQPLEHDSPLRDKCHPQKQ